MLQLIKEAKESVVRYELSDDVQKLIRTKEEVLKDGEVVDMSHFGTDLLEKYDISLDHLRKIQDRHYEVDLKYEQTRDLYAK
mmetsp:Transcript_11413/g.8369  ORF Transcript_11413/g.8369 Transcript_11413/m.8369 type:complete len:82 (+) Transcript_11413:113-358(+)